MRRHGSREDSANIGVVGARGDVEDYFIVGEGGSYNCDVGEVRATVFWVVGDEHVAGAEAAFPD